MRKLIVVMCLALVFPAVASSQEAPMFFQRDAVGQKTYPEAPRFAKRAGIRPTAVLRPAVEVVPERIDEMRTWNEQGRLPYRNGFTRSLGETIDVKVTAAVATKSGAHERGYLFASERGLGIVWAGAFKAEKAARLRVHLEDVTLPAGAVLWVYSDATEPIPFDASLMDDERSIWTPSVTGEVVYIEMEIPSPHSAEEGASFKVSEILELLPLKSVRRLLPEADDAPTCLINQDVTCKTASDFPALNQAKSAIALMEFNVPGGSSVCTGQLINTTNNSGTPYLLTANHCLDSASQAASLETVFDYIYESCISSNFSATPIVRGGTLLATAEVSDYTLIRLPSLPPNRVFLGWNAAPVANGTRLHRISHPVPDGSPGPVPQIYSRTIVKSPNSNPQCGGYRPPGYIYSNELNGGEGGVYGGSSGSAIMLDNGQIVGQLFGSCGGIDPQAGCDRQNDTIDGAFSVTYNAIKQFIAPPAPQTPQPRRRAVSPAR